MVRVRTEARRAAIVQEAARLFREEGYERSSMYELARRLGSSKATLYGYFPSKQELFVAVTQAAALDHLADALSDLERPDDVSLEAGLTRFAQKLIALKCSPQVTSVYRMVVGEAGRSNIGELFFEIGVRRCLDAVARALGAAIDRGELQPEPVDVLAQQLLAVVGAETDLFLFQKEAPTLSEAQVGAMAQRAVRLFLRGCAREPQQPDVTLR